MTRNNFWQVVGEIDSDSQTGVLHMIKRHTSTGSLACDCMAYRFARGEKICKHVSAYQTVTLREKIGDALETPVVVPVPGGGYPFSVDTMTRPGVRRLRLRD